MYNTINRLLDKNFWMARDREYRLWLASLRGKRPEYHRIRLFWERSPMAAAIRDISDGPKTAIARMSGTVEWSRGAYE